MLACLWSAPKPSRPAGRWGSLAQALMSSRWRHRAKTQERGCSATILADRGSSLRDAGAGEGLQEAAGVWRSFGVRGGAPKADGEPLGAASVLRGSRGSQDPRPPAAWADPAPAPAGCLSPGSGHQAGLLGLPCAPCSPPLPVPRPQVTSPGWGRKQAPGLTGRSPGVWQEGAHACSLQGPRCPVGQAEC